MGITSLLLLLCGECGILSRRVVYPCFAGLDNAAYQYSLCLCCYSEFFWLLAFRGPRWDIQGAGATLQFRHDIRPNCIVVPYSTTTLSLVTKSRDLRLDTLAILLQSDSLLQQ